VNLLSWLDPNKIAAKELNFWGAATLSGLLLWLAWPVGKTAVVLFIAWVPLLWMESKSRGDGKGWRFFLRVLWAMIIWNAGTTWWMYYSTAVGSVVAIVANSLLMTLPWVFARKTAQAAGTLWGYLALLLYWCAFEYIHLNWEISWPWLTLGNGFAMFPQWVQWYAFTGVFGGTLWILVSNLALIWWLNNRQSKWLIFSGLWILLPIVGSYIQYYGFQEEGISYEVVAVQPNIDPYTEKFIDSDNFIAFDQQVDRFIHLTQQKLSDSTIFVLWPESAIDGGFEESSLLSSQVLTGGEALQAKDLRSIQKMRQFKADHPQVSLMTGLTSYAIYPTAKEATITARTNGEFYYDVFNTAYFLSNTGGLQTYHKSKLVPGPETMPYPQILGFLSDLLVDFGGTSGQLGKQAERTVFFNEQQIGLAPAICYESIYGDFMARYVRNGAHYIGIITNDGWWRDTAGHKQHLHYAVLRAIENRRAVARSANTGISAFINQRGDIIDQTEFWERDVIKAPLKANENLTFYTRHGDYLGRTAMWLSLLVGLSAWVKRKTTKKP